MQQSREEVSLLLHSEFHANGYKTTLLYELLQLGLEALEYDDTSHMSQVLSELVKEGLVDGEIEYDSDDGHEFDDDEEQPEATGFIDDYTKFHNDVRKLIDKHYKPK